MSARDGEDRTADQLRAAALVAPFWAALASGELVTPDGPVPLGTVGAATPSLRVSVDAGGVADLHGHGPLTAASALEVAARARAGRWPVVRVVVDDPAADRTFVVAPAEAGYRPSAQLARFVRARDRHCRFPGCSASALGADLDHTEAWPRGRTHATNLSVLCRRHHRVKQTQGFAVTQVADGLLRWTTPTGHVHTTGPPG